MVGRRAFLAGMGAVALTAPTATAWAGPRRRSVQAGLPLTVVNNSGEFGNGSIRMYVVGSDLESKTQSRVTADGRLVPVSLSDNGSDGFADYAIPLSGSGETTLNLPSMSGRIYFALGGELKFKVVADGNGNPALQYPAGWVESDPNFRLLHDCVEFTYVAPGVGELNPGMYCNTTMVDQFCVPLAITLDGSRSQTTGTLVGGGRKRIFAQVAAQDSFSSLVVDDLRVIAPGHGLDGGRFGRNYYQSYIDRVWERYRGTDLRVRTNKGLFTGRVNSADELAFVSDGGDRTTPFARPSTRDVLFCDGALTSPNDGITGPVGAILGAGLNRSTVHSHTDQPTTDAGSFYRDPITNHYAKILHSNTVDGRAYGFAYDDVAEFASYVQDTSPSRFTVTLTPF
ncbi:beta-1,3-glucanase family protein [Amycolatopsis palatopharyngis]|uniref:beta-1,3-glucanase family protein n=1 Tax=Amycolatopsis palatopharyngis TaxID=187982 RepID=UPI000E24A7AA|nr:beta-1,3-glucanase family protein [Amycolatopsis palatopharyngis]